MTEQEKRNEELLTNTFATWRAEFRRILADHRQEIQTRLERIEQEIEKKSDKENVELLARSIHHELRRHSDEINRLHARVSTKMGTETMWKIVGLTLTVGAAVGGLISYLINLTLKLNP